MREQLSPYPARENGRTAWSAEALSQLPPEIVTALTIRRTEERLLKLFHEGRLSGTVHTCIGQEWTGIVVAQALRAGDFIISNHRCHGHYLAWTDDVEGLIAEIMGKQSGVCGGRGGSQHLCRDGFLSNGIQGGMVPVAAGMALARQLRGDGSIGTLLVGDGTLGEGVFYEALNLIARWQLPLLIVLENNLYAQSTAQHETLAGDIRARAEAFGIATARGSTWEWQRLLEDVRGSVDSIRHTGQPAFVQVDTYRLAPHSKGDDTREPTEVAQHAEKDPLNRFLASASDPEPLQAVLAAIEQRIGAAVAQAERAPVQAVAPRLSLPEPPHPTWVAADFPEERGVQSIRRALEQAMELDPRVILIGEDLRSPYGGAFKATHGLSDRFPARVLNSPISEAAIVGLGSGLAMEGFRPVIEIMFGDFLLLAADQIVNHAAKFHWMFNEQVSVPLIVRTPMGGGRGYGPTHSQSLEKHLLGIPDTQVLALHHRYAPALTYRALFDTVDRPTIVIENKLLYGQMASCRVPDGYLLEVTRETFPTVRLRPARGAEVTIVAYGGMAVEAEAALQSLFEDHDVLCELIMPVRLYPLDLAPIMESVRQTGRLVVVEEGQGFAGFASEVISQMVEAAPLRPLRVKRVAPMPHPIPAARPLEQDALPNSTSIVYAALEVLDG
ncbi:MAG: pyruvate dehydrogenase [Chloroflexi bacterium]|nr:pyruvate dehydrogenase [Chloroflexota bacterium]